METYSKMIFQSKEAEEEWNNAPESVKKWVNAFLKQNIIETQMKIMRDLEKKMEEKDSDML